MNFRLKNSRRLRATLAVFFGILLIVLAVPKSSHSQTSNDFTYNVKASYSVNTDTTTRVEEVYTVTNNTDNKYLDSIQLSSPIDDAKNISVEYSDGSNIAYTTQKKTTDEQGYNYEYIEITVHFSRKTVGRGSNWKFIVSYDTNKLVETKGSAHTVTIPAVPQDNNNEYSAELFVPENFGTLHTTGIKPTLVGTKRGQTQYRYDTKDQLKKSASLVFGDSTIYQVNFNFPLKNTSSFTSSFTVTLPPTTASQKILVASLDPQPKSTHLDEDGNILADYDVPPRTNITVKTDVIGIVNYLEYNLSASGTTADIPKALVSRYTSPQPYWQSDNPQIIAKAKELTAGKSSVAEQVRAINNFVVSDLTYNNEKIKYNIRQGGLKTLQNPSNAVCLEYSDLTISLLRAAGIPARMPIGYGYSGSLKQSNSVSDSLHSWVQAYVPGVGWMNLDPTWSEKFNNFGSSDLDHMAFAIWGVSDNSPAPVMQNGQDTNYQYENTTIEYKATPPSLQPEGKLSVRKWLIAPFFALAKFDVQAPSTNAGDDYVIRARQGTQVKFLSFGSLAPQQKATQFLPVFGATAFGTLSADFTQTGNTSLILASTKTNSNWWPFLLILIVIAGIIIMKLVKSNLTRKRAAQDLIDKPVPTIIEPPIDKESSTTNEHPTKK